VVITVLLRVGGVALILLGIFSVAASLAAYSSGGLVSCGSIQPGYEPWIPPCGSPVPLIVIGEWMVLGILFLGTGIWLQLAAGWARSYFDRIYRRAVRRLGPVELR
jgi:hypothetical protein